MPLNHASNIRLRLEGPKGAKDEFLLAATAQNLRKLARLIPMPQRRPKEDSGPSQRMPSVRAAGFFNGIR